MKQLISLIKKLLTKSSVETSFVREMLVFEQQLIADQDYYFDSISRALNGR